MHTAYLKTILCKPVSYNIKSALMGFEGHSTVLKTRYGFIAISLLGWVRHSRTTSLFLLKSIQDTHYDF